MGKQLSGLPVWVSLLLEHWGVDVDEFLAHFNELAVKYDVPEEWKAAVDHYLGTLSTTVRDPAAAKAIILAIYLELTGTPGYWKDHGGVA